MGLQDFISEQEATRLTGMSVSTLQRFAEAGYLQIETDTDGLRLFSQDELAQIFGIRGDLKRNAEGVSAKPRSQTAPNAAEAAARPSTLASFVETVISEQANEPALSMRPSDETAATEKAEPVAADPALLEEVQRLRQLVKLQERILDLKEQEVKDLREQRNWLQARVEKLEDKSDRDQVLILTESQTIKTLVNMQNQQKSSVRKALEWFGFADAPQTQNQGEAIEVQKHRQ